MPEGPPTYAIFQKYGAPSHRANIVCDFVGGRLVRMVHLHGYFYFATLQFGVAVTFPTVEKDLNIFGNSNILTP
jgi:hypothetical protein